jgi:DNA-binding transcriptional regulator YdaS (Cro superfamily)
MGVTIIVVDGKQRLLYLGFMASTELSPEKQALSDAAEVLGGQTKLAEALTTALGRPVSQQWVWNVINRPQPVPPEWCLPLERICEGQVSRHQLRPDLYPQEVAA